MILLLPITETVAESSELDEIYQFEIWAEKNGINLVGVNKNTKELYYSGYDSKTDNVNWREIPRVLIAANALYKIPPEIIQVMDGKTIYFSTEKGRSYTVLDSFPEQNILVGLDKGIILEQNINPHTVIHEIGHVVDYHGIQGIYNDKRNIFQDKLEDRMKIFNVTENQKINSSH